MIMTEIKTLSGSQLLIIIYLFGLFLTNFNISSNFISIFFLFYGFSYSILKLISGQIINNLNRKLLILHFLMIIYVLCQFLLYQTEILLRPSEFWWNFDSSIKFLALTLAALTVILTPIEKIIKTINIIRYVSYFIIFESFIYYILPDKSNFLSSDFSSSFRFNGGINSYIITGQILIAGFIAHFQLTKKQTLLQTLIAVSLFSIAIFATSDRTSILAFLVILSLMFYRSGFLNSPFTFKINKAIIYLILASILLSIFSFHSKQNDDQTYIIYKSTFNRMSYWIRSYELAQDVFPFGAGPGSQTNLIHRDNIKMDLNNLFSFNDFIRRAMNIEASNMVTHRTNGEIKSPHNTYFDFLTPLGAIGLFYVFSFVYIQITSLKKMVFNRNNSKEVFLNMFIVSSFVFFMMSSLGYLIWFYLIFYRLLKHNNSNFVNSISSNFFKN